MRLVMMKVKFALAALVAAITLFVQPVVAQEAAPAASDLEVVKASSLDELLDNVEQRRVVESKEHSARERKFAAEKANQARCCRMPKKSEDANSAVQIVWKPHSKKTKFVLVTCKSNWISA